MAGNLAVRIVSEYFEQLVNLEIAEKIFQNENFQPWRRLGYMGEAEGPNYFIYWAELLINFEIYPNSELFARRL